MFYVLRMLLLCVNYVTKGILKITSTRGGNMRRTVNLSKRHDQMLTEHAKKMGLSFTETFQRALEALEEKEVKRYRDIFNQKTEPSSY